MIAQLSCLRGWSFLGTWVRINMRQPNDRLSPPCAPFTNQTKETKSRGLQGGEVLNLQLSYLPKTTVVPLAKGPTVATDFPLLPSVSPPKTLDTTLNLCNI